MSNNTLLNELIDRLAMWLREQDIGNNYWDVCAESVKDYWRKKADRLMTLGNYPLKISN